MLLLILACSDDVFFDFGETGFATGFPGGFGDFDRRPCLVAEWCNGEDDDCDGVIDDDPLDGVSAFVDGDGDGAGVAARVCEGADTVGEGGDCDDANAAAHPGGTETCALLGDEDCDGLANEPGAAGCSLAYEDGDGDGVGGAASCVCAGTSGYVSTGGDCDDRDAAVTAC